MALIYFGDHTLPLATPIVVHAMVLYRARPSRCGAQCKT